MSTNPPVIGFELGVGEFRIVTPEAIYQIRVLPELVTANTALGVISPLAHLSAPVGASPAVVPASSPPPVAPTTPAVAQADSSDAGTQFFQEISEELFARVGQLARQLSISVGELPDQSDKDLSQTGAYLEDAKGQLEEVVELTEKASMTIMDLADQIQLDMEKLNGQIASLNSLESLLEPKQDQSGAAQASSAQSGAVQRGPAVSKGFLDKFNQLKSFVERFCADSVATKGDVDQQVSQEAPQATEIQPAAQPEPILEQPEKMVAHFSLDVIFQTLYEFCTNESVKEHIKDMRAANSSGGFKTELIESELSEMSSKLEPDDGYFNLPIANILKLIFLNTNSEDFKTILKKMNQTASSIFLDQQLPIEAQFSPAPVVQPAAPPPQPPPAQTAPKPLKELVAFPGLSAIEDLGKLVRDLSELLPTSIDSDVSDSPPERVLLVTDGFTSISVADRDTIFNTVAATEKIVKNTTKHLTHIMEALSFQDLSGQRIKKIVGLISEIQVQLLSLLVSVDTKIKVHHSTVDAARPKEETEKVAQAEVDKMLEKLTAETSELKGPGAENRLDQGAVNDLLAQLGF
ncbi:MAG: protein phosphatase CheZ [Deltaproteobacteria bacterium]|jgi:chemotaxis regulatin CheY-phosphate phosphatase CheZ|nr:protein phosphatase CheZ [Deltaproteobacteria bacterium]